MAKSDLLRRTCVAPLATSGMTLVSPAYGGGYYADPRTFGATVGTRY